MKPPLLTRQWRLDKNSNGVKSVVTSLLVFGAYSMVMGAVLLFVPHLVLPWFNLPVAQPEIWLRMLGFVLCCSSYYYIRSADARNLGFAVYTVHTRLMAPLVVTMLILGGIADWRFLPFGLVDGAGGIWTWVTLRKLKKHAA